MELLLCGDVGYGKTEVAMRAAFRAVFEADRWRSWCDDAPCRAAPPDLQTRFSGSGDVDYLSRFKRKQDSTGP